MLTIGESILATGSRRRISSGAFVPSHNHVWGWPGIFLRPMVICFAPHSGISPGEGHPLDMYATTKVTLTGAMLASTEQPSFKCKFTRATCPHVICMRVSLILSKYNRPYGEY